jgi:hypothetical protein
MEAIYSNIINDVTSCFCVSETYLDEESGEYYTRILPRNLNIYVHKNSLSLNTLLKTNEESIIGTDISWTNNGTYYHNSYFNIYIHPVDNVYNAHMNGV